MAKKKRKNFYAVAAGRVPGIYSSWAACEGQVKGFSGAKFQGFASRVEAQQFLSNNNGGVASGGAVPAAAAAAPAAASSHDNFSRGGTSTVPVSKRRRVEPTAAAATDAAAPSSTADSTLNISIYFDGGARGNPGIAGAGAEVTRLERLRNGRSVGDTKVVKIRQYCGPNATNNVAEYTGLLVGLQCARDFVRDHIDNIQKQKNGISSVDVRIDVKGDSNLIISQMEGRYACKSANLRRLFEDCRSIASQLKNIEYEQSKTSLPVRVWINFGHVYRNANKVADALANEAMDERRSWQSIFLRTEAGYEREVAKEEEAKKQKGEVNEHEVVDLCSPQKSSKVSTSRSTEDV